MRVLIGVLQHFIAVGFFTACLPLKVVIGFYFTLMRCAFNFYLQFSFHFISKFSCFIGLSLKFILLIKLPPQKLFD